MNFASQEAGALRPTKKTETANTKKTGSSTARSMARKAFTGHPREWMPQDGCAMRSAPVARSLWPRPGKRATQQAPEPQSRGSPPCSARASRASARAGQTHRAAPVRSLRQGGAGPRPGPAIPWGRGSPPRPGRGRPHAASRRGGRDAPAPGFQGRAEGGRPFPRARGPAPCPPAGRGARPSPGGRRGRGAARSPGRGRRGGPRGAGRRRRRCCRPRARRRGGCASPGRAGWAGTARRPPPAAARPGPTRFDAPASRPSAAGPERERPKASAGSPSRMSVREGTPSSTVVTSSRSW